jgi:GDPmannose 4,6-dehydratase
MKRALITGITGQDGSYLAELLLEKGYAVHGIVRRVALEDPRHRLWRLQGVLDSISLHPADLESYASIFEVVEKVEPEECYHLASQSFVGYSFEDEFSTIHANISGANHILSSLKARSPDCRLYFAASSEMFGNPKVSPQDEATPFYPRSPYGISKLAGYHLARSYRESYGMYVSSGIAFNHESERRGFEFVTRKISRAVANISRGVGRSIRLGNLDASRDWGYAPEYVAAMWLMLQQEKADDFVLATGESHTVREFAESAFQMVNLDWEEHVEIDEQLFRPVEINELRGDAAKAKRTLGWEPKTKFSELVEIMVRHDLEHVQA